MADKKITDLPVLPLGSIIPATDVIPVVNGGITKQVTLADAVSASVSILTPGVSSVNTRTGAVSLTSTDVGLANVNNTSDANKPVSTAQQTALNLKANIASPTFTGTVGGITSTMVGLGNVNNTSDVNKPVSTAQQTALDLKANLSLLQGMRNRIINGNFEINQRAVVSASTAYAAGVYVLDRWKAGAGGVTMSWAINGIDIVVTITAGSLMQVIESSNIEGGVYALQNAGSAQARIAVSGAATSGAYAAATNAAPLASASATPNQTITVEFTTGTVSKVQLEPGTAATSFERRPYGLEFMLCQRYGQPIPVNMQGQQFSTTAFNLAAQLPVPMRAAPTVQNGAFGTVGVIGAGSAAGVGGFTVGANTTTYLRIVGSNTAIGSGSAPIDATMTGFLSAEL